MHLLTLTVSLVKQLEQLWSHHIGRHRVDHQVEHHADAGHRRAQVVGNDRIHLVAIADGGAQLCVLLLNDSCGSHQLNLVEHTHHQLFLVERLRQEVAGTHLETMHQVVGVVEGRQENNRNMSGLGRLLQNLRSIKTTDIRHHDIQQNQVGLLRLGLFDARITTVSSAHLILLVRQQDFEQQNIAHHIVHNQNFIITFNDS